MSLQGMRLLTVAVLTSFLFLTGCASLLPSAKETAKSPWKSFDEVKSAYEKIIPDRTTTQELKSLGFDPDVTPNVKILNYLDVAKTVQPIRKEELDAGLAACLDAKDDCRAYEFELKDLRTKRYGNFWLDLLNFRRNTRESGWRFRTFIVIVRGVTVYKVWGGDPQLEEFREKKNPLGPLQDGANPFIFIN